MPQKEKKKHIAVLYPTIFSTRIEAITIKYSTVLLLPITNDPQVTYLVVDSSGSRLKANLVWPYHGNRNIANWPSAPAAALVEFFWDPALRGAILADSIGLGKTYTALAAFNSLPSEY